MRSSGRTLVNGIKRTSVALMVAIVSVACTGASRPTSTTGPSVPIAPPAPPTAPTPSTASLDFLIGGGAVGGFCGAPCDPSLAVWRDHVSLIVCCNMGVPLGQNNGELTLRGSAKAAAILAGLQAADLLPRYGESQQSTDGSDSWIALAELDPVSGLPLRHRYPFARPPDVLQEADAFVFGLIDALSACRTTAFVVPSAGCIPAGARSIP